MINSCCSKGRSLALARDDRFYPVKYCCDRGIRPYSDSSPHRARDSVIRVLKRLFCRRDFMVSGGALFRKCQR
jgi:hypothetical protein